MRVLHVVATGQRRGAEMFASDLIHALRDSDVSQKVGVLRGDGEILLPYEAPTLKLGVNGWRAPGLKIDPRTLIALRRLVTGWNPDVVQAHGGEALKYSVLASGRRSKVVYRRIGSVTPLVARRLQRMAHGELMRRASRIVTLADVIRHETIEIFRLPPHKVITIPRGVDPRRLEPKEGREATRRLLHLPPTAPVVLFLGALTWEKDPLAYVDIATRLHRRLPEVRYLMVGEGPLRGSVEEQLRSRGLDGHVFLLGSRSDVGDILSASDVMLLPSRTEGMPGCLIEAGMTGLPAAAYAVGGVADVLLHRVTGLLVPPGDISGLESSAFELLGDPEMRRVMSIAAMEHCRSQFDIGSIAPRYLRLYDAVIGDK